MTNWKDKIICPGCGKVFDDTSQLGNCGQCPSCEYENGVEPYRLLTIEEMVGDDAEYDNVRMGSYLKSVLELTKNLVDTG